MTSLSEERKKQLVEIEAGIKDQPFPPQLVIETTSRCNMACLHCSHKEMKRERADMSEALFKKIVEEVARENPECEIWPTFYGEALLLGDKLWAMLDYADQVGCRRLVLNSNGILLAKPGMVEAVLDSPLKRFILSLDGFSAEVFGKIRRGGNRDKIYQAVERLLAEKERRGRKHPVVQCQFSVMEQNRHEVAEYQAYWRERGAEVKVRQMFSWTSTGSIRPDSLDYSNSFRISCPWGANAAAIHQNGDMAACAVDYEGRFVAGNLNANTIKELWQGPHKELLRRPHRQHQWDRLPEICQGCPDWQVVGASYFGNEDQTPGARPFWHQGQKEPA